jgi:hypothetical protein
MSRKPFVLSLVGALCLAFAGAASAQTTPRVSASQKGSLLIYSKIEVKWSADGEELLQDTFLDISNDHPDSVRVLGYFINGDVELEERCSGEPCTPDNIIQEAEPGWNTSDCAFWLTGDQPSFWSAARGGIGRNAGGEGPDNGPIIGSFGCGAFTGLDDDGPGRLDPETMMTTRILRGYAIFWAIRFNDNPNEGENDEEGSPGFWEEIRWNHLKGDALIVNYENGTAWEYNAWAFQAHADSNGAPLPDPGTLLLDGNEYDIPFDTLILDFYGTGSEALSGGAQTVTTDTDLTVHAVSADLRQDNCGPVLTKVEAEIWNEFETKFSGTRRCVCCWDQTMLSNWVRSAAIPNHFRRTALRTDKGKARLDGVESIECDYRALCGPVAVSKRFSGECQGGVAGGGPNGTILNQSEDAAILGLATKFLSFSPSGDQATAGMNLVGSGEESATIQYEPEDGSEELNDLSGRDNGSGNVKSAGKTNRSDRDSTVRDTAVQPGE